MEHESIEGNAEQYGLLTLSNWKKKCPQHLHFKNRRIRSMALTSVHVLEKAGEEENGGVGERMGR